MAKADLFTFFLGKKCRVIHPGTLGVSLALLISLGALDAFASSSKSVSSACVQAFNTLSPELPVEHKIETLDDLLQAFTRGLEPDLSNPSQRDAFEIYRRMRFGDPDTLLNPGSLDEIAQIIQKNPNLEKKPFRDFKLEAQAREYPVTKELASFLDSQVGSSGQVRSNLFQVEANSGFWKKLLQYEDPKGPPLTPLTKDATAAQKEAFREKSKALKEEAQAQWMKFLDQKIAPELRAKLQDLSLAPTLRAKALYEALLTQRKSLEEQQKDLRPISQAIIDLIHTIGYHDPAITKALKSKDGMERLEAYRKILDERDRFAMELGFTDHFDEALQKMGAPVGVSVPSGVPLSTGMTEKIQKLESEIVSGSRVVKNQGSTRTIRHLSLVESPFRSCIGGSDCSSRTYLTRALDPNYHYFTITDETGTSSGHITVVLGEGKMNGTPTKMGFVDKVQNVSNADLPLMMEGVRRSLSEKGYRLAIPDDVGDHNGLSNEEITRSFVAKSIAKNLAEPLIGFKPHAHAYSFKNQYSRAESALPSHAVLPWKLSEGVQLTPDRLSSRWKYEGQAQSLDLNRLVQASVNLKNSQNVQDRLRYIPSMKAIQVAGLKVDPEFEAVVSRWIQDPNESFQLRKQALLYQWTEKSKPLSGLLPVFDREIQVQLLQNILNTPRLKDLVLKEKEGLPGLIAIARQSPKVREALLSAYIGGKPGRVLPLMEQVLGAKDISDAAATSLLRQIKTSLGSSSSGDLKEILKIEKLAQGTSIEGSLQDELLASFVSGFPSETRLGRELTHALHSKDWAVRDFVERLLAKAAKGDEPRFSHLPILKTFQEITSFQNQGAQGKAPLDFNQASLAWMKSEKVNPELKSSFLLTRLGSPQASGKHENLSYEEYRAAIPPSQMLKVTKKIDEATNLGVFEALVAKEGAQGINSARRPLFGVFQRLVGKKGSHALRTLLENTKLESFEFKAHRFPEGGKRVSLGSPADEAGRAADEGQMDVTLTKSFEMQATPVTQLQWALVMGENPSHFKEGGQTIQIHGRDVLMNPNRPVERVSWEDTQKFIQKLNELDPHYNYRLPTEAEWEYAARAGTNTAYSHGDDQSELGAYAWFSRNSGNQTQDVASLKPNPGGLYDMHGNVLEWVQDWYRENRPAHAVDYAGPASGSHRGVRGGSWRGGPMHLFSARRLSYGPKNGFNDVGFRLVREPK